MLSCLSISAQRSCGTEQHMEQLMTNPTYKKDHQKRNAKFKELQKNNESKSVAPCTNLTTLPMAVHFQGISNPDVACLTALAIDQVRILNEDYQGINADISNWNNTAAASFPAISNAETCIEFCLATQNHPSGFGLTNGNVAVTINQFNGDNSAAWSGYINIFVRNIGALGYSPLGGSGNGDGVTIDDQAFGLRTLGCGSVTASQQFNLGRTLTHELGHYLNLDHIWGGGCNSDDGIADTPNSQSSYGGCPNIGVSSCNSTDLHMNYMDYTNDACMYMFSAGQGTVMENYVNANLQAVINKAAIACNNAPPTCTDGIQNQDETGVDCGGTTCPACPSCNDGIQNQDETGIDCGGSICVACPCLDNALTITITFDNYPEETSWQIADANGTVLFEGGPYPDIADGSTGSGPLCLPDGCYDFTISDSFGDGICCQYGNGLYSLTLDSDGSTLASGATFTNSETTNFCLSSAPACQPFLNLSTTVNSGTLTEKAENYITSNSTVTGTAFVTYHAGDYIDLTSGFEVTTGADFHAYILACSAAPMISNDNTSALKIGYKKSPALNHGIVQFTIPADSKVDISVISIEGEEVLTIAGSEVLKTGTHRINLENLHLKQGVYLCKIKTADGEKTAKISLLK